MGRLDARGRGLGRAVLFGGSALAVHLVGLGLASRALGLLPDEPVAPAPIAVSWATLMPAPAPALPARPVARPRARSAPAAPSALPVSNTSTPPLAPSTSQPGDASDAEAPPPPPEPPAEAPAPPPEHTPPTMPVAPPLPSLPAAMGQRFHLYWGDFELGNRVGQMAYTLEAADGRYLLRTEAQAQGLIALVYSGTVAQISQGRIGPAGLQPERYAERRPSRPERAVQFDAATGQLLPTSGDPVPLPTDTQDRLSVFYQLGLLLRATPVRAVAGEAFVLPVASFREVRTERFVVVGEATLLLPQGPVTALHLSRSPTGRSDDPRIDLWLGDAASRLPVRLRLEFPNGRVVDQIIEATE